MNKIYKSIWNEQTGTYVAVSENTKAKGKRSSSALLASAILAAVLGTSAYAQSVTDIEAGNNITVNKTDEGVYTVNALQSTVSGALDVIDVTSTTDASTNITDYVIDLNQTIKANIAAGVSAKELVGDKGLTFTGTSGSTGVKKLGDNLVIIGNDTNISTSADTTGVKISLNKDLDLTSVKTGVSTLNNNGLTVDNGTAQSNIGAGTASIGIVNINTTPGNITGLTNKTFDPNNFVKDRAATEGQLSSLFFEEGASGIRYFRANSTKDDANAEGTDSVAIGPESHAKKDNSFAAGNKAIAEGKSSIALGDGAFVKNLNLDVSPEPQAAIAIGKASVSSGVASTAIGSEAKASAENAVALGTKANAVGASGIALGQGAVAGAKKNISIGFEAGKDTFDIEGGGTCQPHLSHFSHN